MKLQNIELKVIATCTIVLALFFRQYGDLIQLIRRSYLFWSPTVTWSLYKRLKWKLLLNNKYLQWLHTV